MVFGVADTPIRGFEERASGRCAIVGEVLLANPVANAEGQVTRLHRVTQQSHRTVRLHRLVF